MIYRENSKNKTKTKIVAIDVNNCPRILRYSVSLVFIEMSTQAYKLDVELVSYYSSSSGDHECIGPNVAAGYFTQRHKYQPHSGIRRRVKGSLKSLGFILWEP